MAKLLFVKDITDKYFRFNSIVQKRELTNCKRFLQTCLNIWQQNTQVLSLPSFNKSCRVGQGVKTPPFHGGITGSNPVRGTN